MSDRPVGHAAERAAWDAIVRQHHHRVVVSVIALGLRPSRAHEIANDAWARLYEKRLAGELDTLAFPGLAITQARFLALDALRAEARERRRREGLDVIGDLAATVEPPAFSEPQLVAIRTALVTCTPRQRAVFRAIHAHPERPHADVAEQLGLSTQRVRQILCEVRRAIRDALVALEEDDR